MVCFLIVYRQDDIFKYLYWLDIIFKFYLTILWTYIINFCHFPSLIKPFLIFFYYYLTTYEILDQQHDGPLFSFGTLLLSLLYLWLEGGLWLVELLCLVFLMLLCVFVFHRISYSPRWPGTHHVSKYNLSSWFSCFCFAYSCITGMHYYAQYIHCWGSNLGFCGGDNLSSINSAATSPSGRQVVFTDLTCLWEFPFSCI